ncbi:hypothetical protein SBADM41S_07003 [Streptomyces badius]
MFSAFLTAPATLVAAVAASVAREAETAEEDRPAWQAYDRVARARPGDPGLLAALMLQHVRLAPGEGIFLGAGVPHAYLRGLGVEIMASSDNVLRCGLTSKHVDTEELLRVVRATASPVRVLPARRAGGWSRGGLRGPGRRLPTVARPPLRRILRRSGCDSTPDPRLHERQHPTEQRLTRLVDPEAG